MKCLLYFSIIEDMEKWDIAANNCLNKAYVEKHPTHCSEKVFKNLEDSYQFAQRFSGMYEDAGSKYKNFSNCELKLLLTAGFVV